MRTVGPPLQLGKVNLCKLRLGGSAASHGTGAADTSGGSHQHGIGVLCTRPCLVLDDLASVLDFLFLDLGSIGLHSLLGKVSCESVGDESIGVETGKSDELPDESEFTELPNVLLHVLVVEASSTPVE